MMHAGRISDKGTNVRDLNKCFTKWDMRSGDLREVLHDETAAYYLRDIAGGFVKPRAHEILSRPV